MMAFTRWIVTYECIYQRACGIGSGTDSFGGDKREQIRMPKNLKDGVNEPFAAGGIYPIRYRPGTLIPVQQELNPNYRYRTCINPAGVTTNPNPLLGAFCNLNDRSLQDGPTDEFADGSPDLLTRAASFNPLFRFNYLRAARPELEAREVVLEDGTVTNQFAALNSLLVGGSNLSQGQLGTFRALVSSSARAREAGDTALAEQLESQAFALVEDPNGEIDNFDHPDIAELMVRTRPDANIFENMANARAPGLVESKWGHSVGEDFVLPYLGTLGTPIEPLGYFGTDPLDLVGHYASGLATSVAGVSDKPPGFRIDDNRVRQASVPYFVGSDGIRNTADDLPFFYGLGGEGKEKLLETLPGVAGSKYGGDFESVVSLKLDPNGPFSYFGDSVEFFGIFRQEVLVKNGCDVAGGVFDAATGTCTNGGADITDTVFRSACRKNTQNNEHGGINQDGDCIRMITSAASVPFPALQPLGDTSLRPQIARREPVDLTDFQLVAKSEGRGPPARPRLPDGGLDFWHEDLRRLVAKSSRLVSSLDAEFSEDRLRWGWGANEDEGFSRGLDARGARGGYAARVRDHLRQLPASGPRSVR
jgi:hypothetical protein